MKREIVELYDRYTHSLMDRRTFLERLAALAGGVAAAQILLPLLENDYAHAAIIPEDDSRLATAIVTYPSAEVEMRGYLAYPKESEGKLPAVVVIHENRGLNPHIQDVVRRLGVAGYLALAPDALSGSGGTPPDEDVAREKISELDGAQTLADFLKAVEFLSKHERSTGRVGCVGFCWGGAMANQLAVHAADLEAAVAFYGRVPAVEDVPRIQAALLLHYAGRDERINAGIPAYEEALSAAKKDFTIHTYKDVDHAFHNDTNEARYNEEAAKLAWNRTLAFFEARLQG